jgi:hypothetical protein
VGFVLLLFVGIHDKLIESEIIPRLDQQSGSAVVQTLLAYGFWVALAFIVLGFGLQFMKGQRKG